MNRWTAVALGLVLAGCSASSLTVGPVALNSDRQMMEYLSRAAGWRSWDKDVVPHTWTFHSSGTFTLSVDDDSTAALNEVFPGKIPPETSSVTGQWKATQDQLRLSRTTTPSGRRGPATRL